MNRMYILLGIAITLIVVVIFLSIVLFFTNRTPEQESIPTVPTSIPDDAQFDYLEPPPPSTKPEYLLLLEEQPFWNMLPHYGENYLVEYFQSGKTIIITTVDPGNVPNRTELMNQYRQEARDWLTENGAILNQLTIEYRPDIN